MGCHYWQCVLSGRGGFSLSPDSATCSPCVIGYFLCHWVRGISHLHYSLKVSIRKNIKWQEAAKLCYIDEILLGRSWEALWLQALSVPSERNLCLSSEAADSILLEFYSGILYSHTVLYLELKASFPLEFYCFYKILFLVINLKDTESCFKPGQ